MLLNYHIANPAGNVTLLVTSPVEKKDYSVVSQKLMSRVAHAEQVGFFADPIYGGDIRLEMMGGEFCGNALRCAAYYYVQKNIPRLWSVVAAEISGCNRVLEVSADVLHEKAQAEMVLPYRMEQAEQWGGPGAMVFVFDGIAHLVVLRMPEHLPDKALKAYLQSIAIRYHVAAVGLMQVDIRNYHLVPAVYVVDTDSLVYESSCASGSAAAAIYLALGYDDGIFSYDLDEPGGSLNAVISKRGGKVLSVKIGGSVTLGKELITEL